MTEKRRKKRGTAKKRRKTTAPLPPPQRPWWIAAVFAVLLLGATYWAWPARPVPEQHVAHGNEMYERRAYRESLGEYESAPGAGARNAGVQLDRGLARYRVSVPPGDAGLAMLPPDAAPPDGLEQAQEEIRTAVRGGTGGAAEDVDGLLRARAAYDLGNTLFAQHSWDHAIDSYKEALRLRPDLRQAAWNLELARRLREQERTPPDAGQDSGNDASDAADSGNDAHDSGNDGATDSGPRDSGQGDSGGGDSGTASDSGPSGRDSGAEPPRDAGGGPDAAPPRSMAPLDDLDRTSRSLQNELMRRRGSQLPRSPDDDR